MKKIELPYWFILALVAIIWLPNLLAKGMFMDGVYNALFASNLAQGISTFWQPQTIYYTEPSYWDNPPLSMYLLSLWFKILGNHFWVERAYSLFCGLVQLGLLATLWRSFFNPLHDIKKLAWLPVLLFLICPLVAWCYSNNLMENTMAIFTTSSVLMYVMYLRQRSYLALYAGLSGVSIFLALITKGPVGLFPLAAPVLLYFAEEKNSLKTTFLFIVLQTGVFALLFALVFYMPAPQNFLHHYLTAQLIPALTGKNGDAASHLEIFYQLFLALLPWLLLTVAAIFIVRKNRSPSPLLKTALVFIIIGLSASAPIALSAKQHKYYLLPSLPMFVIGFSCLIIPLVPFITLKLKPLWSYKKEQAYNLVCLAVILFAAALCVKNSGKACRDKDLLADIQAIQPYLNQQQVIRADWSLFDAWQLRGYLSRLYNQKLCMPDEAAPALFYITKHLQGGDKLPANAPLILSGNSIDLYRINP